MHRVLLLSLGFLINLAFLADSRTQEPPRAKTKDRGPRVRQGQITRAIPNSERTIVAASSRKIQVSTKADKKKKA